MNELFLLTLIAEPALEEPMVDWLLENETRFGFTSSRVDGHSSQLEGLTLAEQVAGRKRQQRFQLCVEKPVLDRLMERLRMDFSGTGIRYWIIPVIEEGEI